jgi:hypothetical protein
MAIPLGELRTYDSKDCTKHLKGIICRKLSILLLLLPGLRMHTPVTVHIVMLQVSQWEICLYSTMYTISMFLTYYY